MDKKNLAANVLPCSINYNGNEDVRLWKEANSRFNTAGTTTVAEKTTQENTFYPVYNSTQASDICQGYIRGRRLFGQAIEVQDYKIGLFEKTGVDDLTLKGEITSFIVWEHEKLASECNNQWMDIPEMTQVSNIIHAD